MDAANAKTAGRNVASKSKDERTESDGSVGLLKILEPSLEDIRTLITCRVCVRLLFEPYTIECGHTFCYGCLVRWFERDRTKKTCPDCRADVIRPPAPAYLVRDMTQIFVNRAELMPVGETTEEQKQWQEEESALVEKDRSSVGPRGGLFRGCFRIWARRQMIRAAPIRDDEDGVDRCPRCTWELEDGQCGSCGYPGEGAGSSGSDGDEYYHPDEIYDMEHGIDMDDALLETLAEEAQVHDFYGEAHDSDAVDDYYSPPPQIRRRVPHARRTYIPPNDYDSLPDTEEDSEDDGDEGDSLEGCVVTDEGQPRSPANPNRSISPSNRSTLRSTYWETADGTGLGGMWDSDDDHESQRDSDVTQHDASFLIPGYDDEDESDQGPIPPSRRQLLRFASNSDGSASSDFSQAVAVIIQHRAHQRRTRGTANGVAHPRRSIPHHSRGTGRSNGVSRVIEIESGSESPVPAQRQRRRRPIQNRLSLDDESDNEASSGTATLGRRSRRPIPSVQILSGPQSPNTTSHIVIESSPSMATSVEDEDTHHPTVLGTFSPSPPLSERSQSALLTTSSHSPPGSYERIRRSPTDAKHGEYSSARNISTLDDSAYPEQPNMNQQWHRSRLHSPSQARRGHSSPAIRLSRSPMGSEAISVQSVRDRRAQKLEKRAERERLKAEREQRNSGRTQPFPHVGRSGRA